MATRIRTIDPNETTGIRRLFVGIGKREWGGQLPGIMRIALVDLRLGLACNWLYSHLHLRPRSPLTRLQREMVAVVVNGLIGGAP